MKINVLIISIIVFTLTMFSQTIGSVKAETSVADFEKRIETVFIEHYNSAKESTFYAGNTSNGYHELMLTKSYIDSAYIYLNKLPEDFFKKKIYSEQLQILENQYNSSLEIAVDNINYIIPSFSSFAGYRDDFIKVDDAQELLIESLIENIIIQSDPEIKGPIKDNNQFVLVNLNPYNKTLHGVCTDFINMNTNSYAILSHEIFEILGLEGFQRYKSNQLVYQDYEKLMKNYNIDKIYNFSLELDKTSIIKLNYSGISFDIIKKNKNTKELIRYYESFTIEKEGDYLKASTISFLYIILIFSILFFGFNNFSQNKYTFNKENVQSDVIILTAFILSMYISTFILRLYVPEINAFKGEFFTKIWIFGYLVLPTIISIVLITLIHTKFSKSISTDVKNKRKIIFISLLSPAIINVYYSIYSQIIFDPSFLIYSLLFTCILSFASNHFSVILHKIQNKGQLPKLYSFTALLIVLNYFISLVLLIAENSLVLISIVTFIPLLYMCSKLKLKKKANLDLIENDFTYSLANPFQHIKDGTNIKELNLKLDDFINDKLDLVFIIQGESNFGKTRYINEFIHANSSNYECFYGDFNEYKEGSIQLYEPFYEAFCLHSNSKYQLDKGFFSDRSKTFQAMKKVASIASTSSPIDFGELISIDDNQNLSVEEISGELIEILTEFSEDKKMILFLDDFQWIDAATSDLLINFIRNLKRNRSKNIKIVLSISTQQELENSNNEILKSVIDKIKEESNGRLKQSNLQVIYNDQFFNRLFNKNGFKYFKKNETVKFSQNLKIHLRNIISKNNSYINPGYLFNYIKLLKESKLLITENQNLILIKEPGPEITYKDSLHLSMKTKFDNLNNNEKQILESSAYIGVKFDASILTNIWKIDLIEIIKILEKIEDFGIIKDESNYDNLYSFTNKNFHKWIRSNYNDINRSDFSQKVVEIQKRIIDSIVLKGDEFIEKLDIDTLKSVCYRCDKYSHIKEIQEHGLKFNLITAEKLSNDNQRNESIRHLTNIFEKIKSINGKQVDKVLSVLNFLLNQKEGFSDLENIYIKRRNEKFLDTLLSTLITNSTKKQRSYTIILFLKDIYIRNIHKLKNLNLEELEIEQKIQVQRINLIYQYRKFINEKDLLISNFYLTLIENDKNFVPLLNFRKSAINNKQYDLVFKISVQLLEIFNSKVHADEMKLICQDSLYIISEEYEKISQKKSLQYLDIKKRVTEILSNTNISIKNAKNLSKLLSKYVEYFFIIKKYNEVIEISKLAESLAIRINDNDSLIFNWPMCGASSLILNQTDLAEDYYSKMFKLLLKLKAKKEDFIHPVEGILYCCKIKNNYKKYKEIKKELYENLLFINYKMMFEELENSKIDNKKHLSEYVGVKELKISNKSKKNIILFSSEIFKITYVISKSDGEVHESELYNVLQSVNAISFRIGNANEISLKDVKNEKNEIDKLSSEQYADYLNKLSNTLSKKYDLSTLRSIYYFCLEIAKADGVIKDSEKSMLDIIKTNFEVHEEF
jgi:hypothetical protein